MYNKYFKLIILILCSACIMSSCQNYSIQSNDNLANIIEPKLAFQAPFDDDSVNYISYARLFLPDKYTYKLNALTIPLELSLNSSSEETLINELLHFQGDNNFASVNYGNNIGLYGNNPIEVNQNSASVNITANALLLDREQLYLLVSSISETLMDFNNIEYVNILVADKALSLDLIGHLPLGTIEKQKDNDPYASYIKLFESRDNTDKMQRVSEIPCMLYFASGNGLGIVAEPRILTFKSFEASEIVSKIIKEIDNGARLQTNNVKVPNFYDMLSTLPIISEWAEGGNLITLKFKTVFEDVLGSAQINKNTAMAMLCYSICSFYPDAVGIRVYIGNQAVEFLESDSINNENIILKNSIITRNQLSKYLLKNIKLYFANQSENNIVATIRQVPEQDNITPRKTLLEINKGPSIIDSANAFVEKTIDFDILNSQILGFSLQNDMLIINFDESIVESIKKLNPDKEKLFVYSVVNTLCTGTNVKSLMFLFNGKQLGNIAGSIYWTGNFMPNLKIVK